MTKMATANDTDRNLPAGWRWVQLGQFILETRNGFGRRPQVDEEGPVVLRLADVSNGVVDLSSARRDFMSEDEINTYRLQCGDLLFVRVNGSPDFIGKCILVESDYGVVCFNDHLIRVRVKAELLPEYLSLVSRAPAARSHFVQSSSTSAGQLTINRDSLDSFVFPLPPLSEQRRIAGMLREKMVTAERARAAVQAQLEATMALPVAFARETLRTGQTRKYLLGDCLTKIRTGIGADWSKYPVLGATRNGLAPAKEGVGKAPERYKLVDPVTVFYNPMRILLGSIAMVDEENTTGITSPDYVVVKGRPGILNTRWFYYWFRSTHGAHLIDSLSRGAVRERILFNRLAAGEIELPDYETQLRVSGRMKQVRPVVEIITKELQTIDALPSAILREVFAGAA